MKRTGKTILLGCLTASLALASPIEVPEGMRTHRGHPLTTSDLRGKWTLLLFGFTSCGQVCPTSLRLVTAVRAALRTRAKIPFQTLFVTVDPQVDSASQLERFLAHFGGSTIGVTGEKEALSRLSYELSGKPVPHQPSQHSGTLFLVSPLGEVVARFSRSTSRDRLTGALSTILDAQSAGTIPGPPESRGSSPGAAGEELAPR